MCVGEHRVDIPHQILRRGVAVLSDALFDGLEVDGAFDDFIVFGVLNTRREKQKLCSEFATRPIAGFGFLQSAQQAKVQVNFCDLLVLGPPRLHVSHHAPFFVLLNLASHSVRLFGNFLAGSFRERNSQCGRLADFVFADGFQSACSFEFSRARREKLHSIAAQLVNGLLEVVSVAEGIAKNLSVNCLHVDRTGNLLVVSWQFVFGGQVPEEVSHRLAFAPAVVGILHDRNDMLERCPNPRRLFVLRNLIHLNGYAVPPPLPFPFIISTGSCSCRSTVPPFPLEGHFHSAKLRW
mmetsp:Transcript_21892/g.57128  ORF Transcript_21892/g.57128 Transcript_21892/m.57128 type:complete len:294 (-) Transcript_21892:196-1077(-)